jgi:hypothetical protein
MTIEGSYVQSSATILIHAVHNCSCQKEPKAISFMLYTNLMPILFTSSQLLQSHVHSISKSHNTYGGSKPENPFAYIMSTENNCERVVQKRVQVRFTLTIVN